MVEVCRACEGYHLHRAVIVFFQKKALKARPQTTYPKKIVKRTLKDDSILKKSNGGQGMEEKRRKRLILRMKAVTWPLMD